MLNPIKAYTRWLHTKWPAGKVERLPVVREDGTTNVAGLYVVGDLTGIPLLKLSANAGTRVVRRIAEGGRGEGGRGQESGGRGQESGVSEVLDVAIVGGGTAGFAAALEARSRGLRYVVFEASEPFSTIVNFPKEKPIYKYPTQMDLEGDLQFHDKSDVKEGLLEDLREQTVEQGVAWVRGRVEQVERRGRELEVVCGDAIEKPADVTLNGAAFVEGKSRVRARHVVVAIGRSGNYRKLGVPGEDKDHKVFNRLHDPKDYCGQDVLVVGGGDSAMEAAIALTKCGANVTLSYRKDEFNRPKPENREMLLALAENPRAEAGVEEASDQRVAASTAGEAEGDGSLTLVMPSNVKEIREDEVDLETGDGEVTTIANDSVFAMIGREPPLDFFRRSGVKVVGDRGPWWWTSLIAFVVFCFWLYHWKGQKALFGIDGLYLPAWLAPDPAGWINALQATLGGWAQSMTNPIGVLLNSAQGPAFWYTLAYSLIVVIFGIRRIRRRRTPYVTWQTSVLMAIQVLPLFVLPELLLPWFNALGWFDAGVGAWVERTLFPGESWWRAYGLILAWPLMAWNWFTAEPIWGWLVLGGLQTFVLIPAGIYFWGKGVYCGWICSCGALAETLGDQHRHKMPHGPLWNRLNMLGQGVLLFAGALMVMKVLAWSGVGFAGDAFAWAGQKAPVLNYAWLVDLFMAGVLGYGLYFWFSGRMWCRFACPLAALMHVYHRLGRFAIVADKKKCISCNVCTSVCHQGIDVMSFANKGEPMVDPECVRCSACVQMCPTGVLSFGQVDRAGRTIKTDPAWLSASRVQMAELTVEGKPR